jgi:hypothetical protein
VQEIFLKHVIEENKDGSEGKKRKRSKQLLDDRRKKRMCKLKEKQ